MKKIKQIISVSLAVVLSVPVHLFTCEHMCLAPSGISKQMVSDALQEEAPENISDGKVLNALIEIFTDVEQKPNETYKRIAAAPDLVKYPCGPVITALAKALSEEQDDKAQLAEIKAFTAIARLFPESGEDAVLCFLLKTCLKATKAKILKKPGIYEKDEGCRNIAILLKVLAHNVYEQYAERNIGLIFDAYKQLLFLNNFYPPLLIGGGTGIINTIRNLREFFYNSNDTVRAQEALLIVLKHIDLVSDERYPEKIYKHLNNEAVETLMNALITIEESTFRYQSIEKVLLKYCKDNIISGKLDDFLIPYLHGFLNKTSEKESLIRDKISRFFIEAAGEIYDKDTYLASKILYIIYKNNESAEIKGAVISQVNNKKIVDVDIQKLLVEAAFYDKDGMKRMSAISTLKLYDSRYVKEVVKGILLSKRANTEDRMEAAKTLGFYGTSSELSELIRVVNKRKIDPRIRTSAMNAIVIAWQEEKGKGASPILGVTFIEEKFIITQQQIYLDAINAIGKRLKKPIVSLSYTKTTLVREGAVLALGNILNIMDETTENNKNTFEIYLKQLIKKYLTDAYKDACRQHDSLIRGQIVQALGKAKQKNIFWILADIIETDQSELVRLAALKEIINTGNKVVVDYLLGLLEEEKTSEVFSKSFICKIISELENFPCDKVVTALINIFESSDKGTTIAQIARQTLYILKDKIVHAEKPDLPSVAAITAATTSTSFSAALRQLQKSSIPTSL